MATILVLPLRMRRSRCLPRAPAEAVTEPIRSRTPRRVLKREFPPDSSAQPKRRARVLRPPALQALVSAASETPEVTLDEILDDPALVPAAGTRIDEAGDDAWSSFDELEPTKQSKQLQKLDRRKMSRRRLVARDPRFGVNTFLENHSVTQTTWEKYQTIVQQWLEFCASKGLKLITDADVDSAVVRWMNEQFLLGHMPWKGEVVIAGIQAMLPEFGRHGARKLPRVGRCLAGWKRLCPGSSRVPLPECTDSRCRVLRELPPRLPTSGR